jgi:D-beta-D-heptose 7-phosphate kinase/D-beta-D-heptose 1-phosphate adenosyltransferase
MSLGQIHTRQQLIAARSDWKRAGQKVVFTNGCYDVLHPGHIRLLEAARSLGDVLILALNTDASVQRLKGPTRPIVNEKDRATVLSALAAIDAVVLFDEDTPLELIKAIQPDVLVKGGDYIEATVVGAEQVRAQGGRVEIVPTVEGFSTTGILQRINTPTR